MNSEERLLKAFGGISDKYIEEAAPEAGASKQVVSIAEARKKKVPWRAMSTVAACLVLALSIGIYRQNGIRTEYAESTETEAVPGKTQENAAAIGQQEGNAAADKTEETAGNETAKEEIKETEKSDKTETAGETGGGTAAAGAQTEEAAGEAAVSESRPAEKPAETTGTRPDSRETEEEPAGGGIAAPPMTAEENMAAQAGIQTPPEEAGQTSWSEVLPAAPTETQAAPSGPASDMVAAGQNESQGPAAEINAPKVAGVFRPIEEALGHTQEPGVQMANPYHEYDSIDEAVSNAGIPVAAPSSMGEYDNLTYRVIPDTMTEIIYRDDSGAEGLRIRKAVGTEDISGVYDTFEYEHRVQYAGRELNLKGNAETVSVVTWTNGVHSYAICAPEHVGLTAEQALVLASATE